MITIKIKIENEDLEEFLKTLDPLNQSLIKQIDYKIPKAKVETINTPLVFNSLLSTHELILKDNRITHNGQVIKDLQFIGKYEVFKKMAEKMGLTFKPMPKSSKYWKKINDEVKADVKTRLMIDKFTPIVEVVKLPKVDPKDKDFYISIVRNTPTLFDVATYYKRAKDTYCLMYFQELDTVTTKEFKIISKIVLRKAFNLYKIIP